LNSRQIKKEIHDLEMCLACDDNLGLLTKSKMEDRIKYLERLLKKTN